MAPNLPWKRLARFGLLPLASAISPFLVLPVLTRVLGSEGWSSIAIGQSIGLSGSMLINFGWGVVGPSEVARGTTQSRLRVYRESLFMRLLISAVVLPGCYLGAEALDPLRSGGAGVMAAAMALSGLGATWYFIGLNKPFLIALFDTLPRIVAAGIAIPALFFLPHVLTYPILLFFTCSVSVVFCSIRLAGRMRVEKGFLARRFKQQWALVLSGLIAGLYSSFATVLVGLVNYSAVAVFAAADRLRGLGKQGVVVGVNALQGWVVEEDQMGSAAQRMRSALTLISTLGIVCGVFLALGLPRLDNFIFGPDISIPPLAAGFAGLALAMTSMSSSMSLHVLAPSGNAATIATATTLGALVGAPSVLLFAMLNGPSGALAGMALAEFVVVLYELRMVRRILRR